MKALKLTALMLIATFSVTVANAQRHHRRVVVVHHHHHRVIVRHHH